MPARARGAPDLRGATVRQELLEILRRGPATARDLSRLAGIRERDVAGHLEHLARSLKAKGETLELEPSACLDCGFVFRRRERHRYTRPGQCPECRSRRISLPRFFVQPR